MFGTASSSSGPLFADVASIARYVPSWTGADTVTLLFNVFCLCFPCALAIFGAYAVGRHTYLYTTWLRECLFWCSGACAVVLVVQCVQLVYHNDMLHKSSTVRIYADHETRKSVLIMEVPRGLKMAGRTVNRSGPIKATLNRSCPQVDDALQHC